MQERHRATASGFFLEDADDNVDVDSDDDDDHGGSRLNDGIW